MATVALDIYTSAYPSITNDIEIRIYKQSDTMAIIASLRHVGPHGDDVWPFPGLQKTNYLFRIFEMSGVSIVQQLGNDMYVNPGGKNGVSFKATEQIQADFTTGLVSGTNTFTFDGTAGKEDWRGWEISTIERIGQGAMKKGVDYSWDKVTGIFTLLQPGDAFAGGEWFNVEFEAQTTSVTDSVGVAPLFSIMRKVTANYTVDINDFDGVLICKPVADYIELQLPDIAIVPEGKRLTIEMGFMATQKCVNIKTNGSNPIDWLLGARTNLYLHNQESITLYKFIDGTAQWRVYNPFGNWLQVGEAISDDSIVSKVFNKLLYDGSRLDTLQYARLYNDYILLLPPSQVVNYDSWATGNNKYRFSLANSSNPANAGKFLIPDRRNLFERNTDGTRVPGEFQVEMIGSHFHQVGTEPNPIAAYKRGANHQYRAWSGTAGLTDGTAAASTDLNTSSTENRPANIAIRKYFRI